MQFLLIDVSQSTHESVILAVTTRIGLVGFSIYLDAERCCGFQSIGCGYEITHKAHAVVGRALPKHVRDDVGQVVGRNNFFLVAQFDDALRYGACLLCGDFQAQCLKVFEDIGFSAVLSQSILTPATKTFGQKGVAIKSALVIAIGMHTCYLCEYIFAHDGPIGRHGNSAVAFHKAACFVKPALVHGCGGRKMVSQQGLHT